MSPRPNRRTRIGLKLERRLVLQLVLLALVIEAVVASASLLLVGRSLEGRLATEVQAGLDRARAELDAGRVELDASLDGLEERLRRHEPRVLEALLRGGAEVVETAGRLMRQERLDLLEIVDPDGTVVSSGRWPERAGVPLGELFELPRDRVVLQRVAGPTGETLARVLVRRLEAAGLALVVVGGHELDQRLIERLAGGRALALLPSDAGEPVLSTAAGDLDWSAVRAAGSTDVSSAAAAAGWAFGRLPLTDGRGRELGELVVAIDRSSVDSQLSNLRRTFVALGAVAAVIAALGGAWIARRTTRPVAELVRAVDGIAAGTADYTFTRQVEDEFEELVTAFSRLHRSLELQRERSRVAERVAAWREVARRVAHEVKNPLAPIRLTVENLIRARGEAPELFESMFREGMQTILEEVERLRKLVDEFSRFARLPRPERKPVDLSRLVDRVLALHAGDPGIEVVREGDRALPTTELDADQMARALGNVVGNALDSLRGQPAPRLEVTTRVEDSAVEIEVADNGAGFTTEALSRQFEPYFTTKPDGTGLGLAITYRIVVEHGGTISAGNGPEGGARVTIRLPL